MERMPWFSLAWGDSRWFCEILRIEYHARAHSHHLRPAPWLCGQPAHGCRPVAPFARGDRLSHGHWGCRRTAHGIPLRGGQGTTGENCGGWPGSKSPTIHKSAFTGFKIGQFTQRFSHHGLGPLFTMWPKAGHGPYGDRRRPASCASNASRFFQRKATLALKGPCGDRRV